MHLLGHHVDRIVCGICMQYASKLASFACSHTLRCRAEVSCVLQTCSWTAATTLTISGMWRARRAQSCLRSLSSEPFTCAYASRKLLAVQLASSCSLSTRVVTGRPCLCIRRSCRAARAATHAGLLCMHHRLPSQAPARQEMDPRALRAPPGVLQPACAQLLKPRSAHAVCMLSSTRVQRRECWPWGCARLLRCAGLTARQHGPPDAARSLPLPSWCPCCASSCPSCARWAPRQWSLRLMCGPHHRSGCTAMCDACSLQSGGCMQGLAEYGRPRICP